MKTTIILVLSASILFVAGSNSQKGKVKSEEQVFSDTRVNKHIYAYDEYGRIKTDQSDGTSYKDIQEYTYNHDTLTISSAKWPKAALRYILNSNGLIKIGN